MGISNFLARVAAAFVFTAFCLESSAAPWEGPRLSEEELTKLETSSEFRGRTNLVPRDFSDIVRESYHLMFVELFDNRLAEKNNHDGEAVPETSRSVNVAHTATMVDGARNGFGTSRNHALFTAGVALDLISWLSTSETPSEKLRNTLRKDFDNLKYPSLWLIRREQGDKEFNDKATFDDFELAIRENFAREQALLLSLDINCDQSYYRSTNPFGVRVIRGGYFPAIGQSRQFVCGHDDLDLSALTVSDEVVMLSTQRAAPNVWMSRYYLTRLDKKTGIQKILGVEADKINFMGELLYKRIKGNLGDEWYAVYTVPNASGDWIVKVVKGESEAEYPLPPNPSAGPQTR